LPAAAEGAIGAVFLLLKVSSKTKALFLDK
jgi:hypothetical protein